jgi:mannose-6-phosphate isomerase-like protein (cupin superfamily)
MTGTYAVQVMKVLPNAKMPIHLHAYPQVYIVLEGSAKLRVGTETREVKAGQVVFLPANVEHETCKAGSQGMSYIVIE